LSRKSIKEQFVKTALSKENLSDFGNRERFSLLEVKVSLPARDRKTGAFVFERAFTDGVVDDFDHAALFLMKDFELFT